MMTSRGAPSRPCSAVEMETGRQDNHAVGAVILFGPPGAGKGTQARRIAERFGVPQISTGDMIRSEIHAHSTLGKSVRARMEAGHLVSDAVVNEMVEARVRRPDCRAGFLLDGYPRTPGQAEKLRTFLKPLGHPAMVIEIQIGYNELVKRITGRRLCPKCGAIFNIHSNPPKTSDVCDVCGARLVVRTDDRAEVLEERLHAYEQQTVPLFEVFRKNGEQVYAVDGTLPATEVGEEIFRLLNQG